MNDPTLRVDIRFSNARLYNAICRADHRPIEMRKHYGPVAAFCRAHEFSTTLVCGWLTLRLSPFSRKTNEFLESAKRLAAAVCEVPEDIFPRDLYSATWPRLAVETSHERFVPLMAAGRARLTLPPAQEQTLIDQELSQVLFEGLATLPPRDAEILIRRFGLDGEPPETLDQIAARYELSRGRIQQIERRALVKMRHPRRSRRLKPFLERSV